MYWPFSSPSVYEQELPIQNRILSYDGLEDGFKSDTSTDLLGEKPSDSAIEEQNLKDHTSDPESSHTNPSSGSADSRHQKAKDTSKDDWNVVQEQRGPNEEIVGICNARSGHLFATITRESLSIWQTKPTVLLASVARSSSSLKTYGTNVSPILRPDNAILAIQTSQGYLITYSLLSDPNTQSYQLIFLDGGRRHARRKSVYQGSRTANTVKGVSLEGGSPVHELSIRFRMAIKIDAGVSQALALDDELLVVTPRPAAIQCIRWVPDRAGNQTTTGLLSRMQWLTSKGSPLEVVYDRPMNLFVWTMGDGKAYAVRRVQGNVQGGDSRDFNPLFDGHQFHTPETDEQRSAKAAVNSKFSLIAIGCADASIWLYSVRDYSGGITCFRRLTLPVSVSTSGKITTLAYSPDGYCLFAGFEHGWMVWSVYGQPGASSFGHEITTSLDLDKRWLAGVLDAFWTIGGSEAVILNKHGSCFYVLEFVRSALTNCLASSNVSNALLQTSGGLKIYQGYDTPDLTTISADVSLWHEVHVPNPYLDEQWPMKAAVASPDGRYLAVAGQRGLAHYSVASGRWKVFEDVEMQNEFSVRGGMCWHQHILIAAIETNYSYELRVYSRETSLDNANLLQVINLDAPAVHIATSGDDSILVYTYENVLDHYIVIANKKSLQLSRVGQIGLHGIIRSPARVRAVSWIVPDHQLRNGDPSQDVAVASVLFLVDGKLVLLQPSTNDEGELKYDMRVVAQNVEFYYLARDSPGSVPSLHSDGSGPEAEEHALRDSLWVFDGQNMRAWIDVQTLLEFAPAEYARELPVSTSTPVDFYPLSVLMSKGILFGVESELSIGRDANFTIFRTMARTTLFIPDILRDQLAQFNSPGALHLSHRYQGLPYFAHALEVLLHNVLDDEVENPPPSSDNALLPAVLSFLSSFPEYLEVVVQCTRKTELRSWRTLFAHLPPPQELFEASLEQGALKTAAGYLLVLHTLTDVHSTSPQVIRLLRAAREGQDWELCKELARFLMALDESGRTLEQALNLVNLASPSNSRPQSEGESLTNGFPNAGNGTSDVRGEMGFSPVRDRNNSTDPFT